jgi:copper chaperone CopZ
MMRRSRLAVAVLSLIALSVTAMAWSKGADPADQARTVLTIKGMTCGGCVATVKLRLKKIEGVTAFDVSLQKGEADVTYDPDQTSPQAIAAAVSETGFKATVKPDGEKMAEKGSHQTSPDKRP